MRKTILGGVAFITFVSAACQASHKPLKLELFQDKDHKFETVEAVYGQLRGLAYKESTVLTTVKPWFDWGLPLCTSIFLYKGLGKSQKSLLYTLLGGLFGVLTATHFTVWRKRSSKWKKDIEECGKTVLNCANKLKDSKNISIDSLEQYLLHAAFFKQIFLWADKEKNETLLSIKNTFQKTVDTKLNNLYEKLVNNGIYTKQTIKDKIQEQLPTWENEIDRIRDLKKLK